MTTYLIGTGQTYTTIASFFAAVTPVAGDIIDGTNSSFLIWSLDNHTGLSNDSRLTFQNAVIDGANTTATGISTHNDSYITLSNITAKNCTSRNIYTGAAVNTDYIINNIVSENGYDGIYLREDTLINAYDITITNATHYGLYIVNCSGIYSNINISNCNSACVVSGVKSGINEFDACSFIGSAVAGLSLTASANGTEVSNCIAENNLSDGFSLTATSNCVFTKNISTENGIVSNAGSGDAFTSHVGCLNNTFIFNFSKNNLSTAHAHIETSSGSIYHHTSINDGISPFTRASLCITSTGTWTIKNNIFYNNQSYPIAYCGATPAITADYNCYISNLSAPFVINAVANKTFAQWITAVGNETHSLFIHENNGVWDVYYGSAPTVKAKTLSYCPVNTDGTLANYYDNPLIDAGVAITDINNVGTADLFDYPVTNKPNIGCSQQYYLYSAGTLTFDWTPAYNKAAVTGELNIVSFDGSTNHIYYDATNGLMKVNDGTNIASVALNAVANTTYSIKITWETGTGLKIWNGATAGSLASFAGSFNVSGDTIFFLNCVELQYLNSLKLLKTSDWS